MKKLTPEQRDWIIKQMDGAIIPIQYTYTRSEIGNLTNMANFFKGIIDQCTEQEFPAFEMRHSGSWNTAIDLDKDLKEYVNLKLWYCERDPAFYAYELKEFKYFVSQCNKIVEWIDKHG